MKYDITQLRKEFIYDIYIRIVEEPKDYKKVTRKTMVKEVLEYYMQDNHLELCLSYQDILDLKEIIKNDNQAKRFSKHLYNLLLLDYVNSNDLKPNCIHLGIYNFIKEHIDSYDLKKAKQRDEMNFFIIGIIKCYGIMSLENFIQYIQMYNDIYDMNIDIENDIMENRVIREYYYLENDGDKCFVVNKLFEDCFEDCLEIQDEQSLEVKLFSNKELINIGQYDFDISKKPQKNLYNELIGKSESRIDEMIKDNLLIMLNLQYEYEDIKDYFFEETYLGNYVTNKLLKYIKKTMNDIPLAIYYGRTRNEYSQSQEKTNVIQHYLKSEKQVNAHLSTKDARSFYKMYMGLLDYVNNKYHIVKNRNFATAYQVNPADQVEIREKLFQDMSIIDEYITKNSSRLNQTVLKQVQEIKNAIKVKGMIVKYEKNYTIFLDEHNVLYGIIGAVSNLDEIIDVNMLPYMCELALVPYKGKIVYDGVIQGALIKMGPGIQTQIANSLQNQEVHKTISWLN